MTLGGLVVVGCLKAGYNQGQLNGFYYFRDSNGREIDLIYEKGRKLDPAEIWAGFTFTQRYLSDLKKMQALTDLVDHACLLYNGEPRKLSGNMRAIHTADVQRIFT